MKRLPIGPMNPKVIEIADQGRVANEWRMPLVAEPIPMGQEVALRIYYTRELEEPDVTIINVEKEKWDTYELGKWGHASINNMCKYKEIQWINEEKVRELFGGDLPDEWQLKIIAKRRKKRREKKRERIDQLMAQAEPLPKNFYRWMEDTVMIDSRYMIFEPTRKKKRTAYCTVCGYRGDIENKGVTNDKMICPNCQTMVTLKAAGRMKKKTDRCWTQYVQPMKDGAMIRYFSMEKMYDRFEHMRVTHKERLRVVFEKGTCRWYEYRPNTYINDNGWINYTEDKWCQNNQTNQTLDQWNFPHNAYLYRFNLKSQIDKTKYRYVPWKNWMEDVISPCNYREDGRRTWMLYDVLEAIERIPIIESLNKIGWTRLVEEFRRHLTKYNKCNKKEKKLHRILGLTKEQFRWCVQDNVLFNVVEILQITNELGLRITVEQAYDLIHVGRQNVKEVMSLTEFASVNKIIDYALNVETYMWLDYIKLGKEYDYNFKDPFVLFPRDLSEAHDAAIAIQDEEKNRKALEKARKEDKSIQKVARKYDKRFTYEGQQFFIRIAKSNTEIVREGQILHHCVGCGRYRDKMMKEESFILFLRKVEEPEKPYCTIEIDKDFGIVQWFQKHDEKPDRDIIQPFLDEYVEVKRNGKEYHAAG